MNMNFVPVNQRLWTSGNALVYGYADPYDKRQKREPDAMILKDAGVYHCAIGPDWNQDFVAEVYDADSAKYECTVAWAKRSWARMKEKKA